MGRTFVPKLSFIVGQIVEIQGRRHRYVMRAPDGSAVFQDEETQDNRRLPDAEIARLIAAGNLDARNWLTPLTREEESENARMLAELQADQKVRDATVRRFRYVQAWVDSGQRRYTKGILRPLLQKVANDTGDPKPPGPSTVQKWIKRWREYGRVVESLAPRFRLRGNRSSRFPAEVLDMADLALDAVYLQDGEPPLTSAHKKLENLVGERNEALPPDMKLPIPSKRTFYRILERRIDEYTRVATRRSKQEADALYRPVGSGPVVERINDYWEIDHTEHTGVLAVDGATGLMIGHPWVSVVLDRCSTMPVGFHLGFDGPSIFATFECLRNAVLPKDYMREAYPQIENDWPCFGLPRTIVPDNGSDFRSSHFMAACLLLATDIQYTPVAKPWYKGRLERFFQTLQTQCRSVSSARFADYYRRARRKQPDQVSLITLEELTMLLHKWIADVYAVSPHRRFDGRCPRQVWENSARVHGIVPPPSRERLFSILSLTEFRVPHKYGIEFLGLRYNSARLAEVRIAPNAPKEFRVQIDPGDLGAIRVQDFETGEFFPVEVDTSQRGIAAGVTLHQYKVARALVRNNPDRFSSDADIAKALIYIMEYGRERQGKGTQRERRAIARHTFKPTHREIQQQAGAPGQSLRSVTEELLDGTDMPVPDTAAASDATGGDTPIPPPEDDLDLDAEARRLGVRSDTIRDMGNGNGQE